MFAEFFNGHLWARAIRLQNSLKWLHHRQDDDQNHERRRDLVQDSIKTGWPLIGVLSESTHTASEIAVQSSKTKNQDEFRVPPAIPPISGQIDEVNPVKKTRIIAGLTMALRSRRSMILKVAETSDPLGASAW